MCKASIADLVADRTFDYTVVFYVIHLVDAPFLFYESDLLPHNHGDFFWPCVCCASSQMPDGLLASSYLTPKLRLGLMDIGLAVYWASGECKLPFR
jgi:hypothetical protein